MSRISEQYDAQKTQAAYAIAFCGHQGPLHLVFVASDGIPPVIAVVGGAISVGAIDVWKRQGARVRVVETLGG
jgi:hypothetical protein